MLELSKSPEDVEDQPATGRVGVEGLVQADQGDAAVVEVTDDVDEVAKAPAEAVQPPHHQAVTPAGALQRTH